MKKKFFQDSFLGFQRRGQRLPFHQTWRLMAASSTPCSSMCEYRTGPYPLNFEGMYETPDVTLRLCIDPSNSGDILARLSSRPQDIVFLGLHAGIMCQESCGLITATSSSADIPGEAALRHTWPAATRWYQVKITDRFWEVCEERQEKKQIKTDLSPIPFPVRPVCLASLYGILIQDTESLLKREKPALPEHVCALCFSVAVRVNIRGTAGRGDGFLYSIYKNLSVVDKQDIMLAAQ